MSLDVCRECGQPATKTLCAYSYCHPCAETILAPIRERQITREPSLGIGIHTGRLRPDHHDGYAELTCDICQATWVGPPGEDCDWCLRWLQIANEVQRAALLRPELPDADDARYAPAVTAWVKRLAAAVDAELVTVHEARTVLDRIAPRHVA